MGMRIYEPRDHKMGPVAHNIRLWIAYLKVGKRSMLNDLSLAKEQGSVLEDEGVLAPPQDDQSPSYEQVVHRSHLLHTSRVCSGPPGSYFRPTLLGRSSMTQAGN